MYLFETPRLKVRALSMQDLPALTAILSDPAVMEYSIRGVCDEAATRQFIQWCEACYASSGIGPWALEDRATGELVGFCGINPEQVDGQEEISLGYRLAQRYWGKGLAAEAASAVLQYAFCDKGCESLVAIIEPAHGASIRVAEKAGFAQYTLHSFHDRPVRLYRLGRLAWRANTQRLAGA